MFLFGIVIAAVFMFFLLLTCHSLSKGELNLTLYVITALAFGLLYGATMGMLDMM